MNYTEAQDYINELGKRGSILGLTRMGKLCEILGNPQDKLKIIHIAGTNGKGSTACFIATILREAGYKTAMYYSPALTQLKDHYTINGLLISDEDYANCVSVLKDANESLRKDIGEEATQFELETALAFYYFAEQNCDFLVLETGLGGRDDATNIVRNKLLCVFTSISFDHMAILGNTLSDIAKVKSGIITSSCKVVAFASSDEVVAQIKDRCIKMDAECRIVERSEGKSNCSSVSYGNYKDITVGLKGSYQKDNAMLAIAAADALNELGANISEQAVRKGIEMAKWPFRFEKIMDEPLCYVDGAHNEEAAIRLRQSVLDEFPDKKIILVIGCFKDKEYDKLISIMAPLADKIVALTTPFNKDRALDKSIIKMEASKYCGFVAAAEDIDMAAAMAAGYAGEYEKGQAVILACGSLSYLSAFKDSMNNNKETGSAVNMDGLLYNRIISNAVYKEHLHRIEELETYRIYCHHDMVHFMDVARIAYILALTENIEADRDEIYAAALLHDIGRDVQYMDGTKHEKASAAIAPKILAECGYSNESIGRIVEAIREHGNEESRNRRDLTGVIYRGDKLSRKCFYCNATESCHKDDKKKNMYIKL